MEPSTTLPADLVDAGLPTVGGPVSEGAAQCPFSQAAVATAPVEGTAGACPVRSGLTDADRSAGDLLVRRILRIRDRRADVTDAQAYGAFQRSMAISAIRCTLTYVVFPFVLPAVGFATGVGPVIGLIIGSIAIVCDVFAIRRFFAVDHKYRWHFGAIGVAIIALLTVLMVQDISHIVGNLLS